MVVNSALVGRVAHVSANACQYIACNPERFSSDRVLYLLFCFPFLHFRRFSLSVRAFFCFPSLDSDLDDDGNDDRYADSHSD